MAPYWFTDSFDPVGNRTQRVVHAVGGDTTTSYGYAPGTHQVTTATSMGPAGSSASSFVYDDAGNTTTRDVAGDPVQALVWDAEGELVSVTAGATTDTYVYTADGDRLVRRQAGATTVYLPGGMELTATGGTVSATRYYAFNGQVVAVRTGPGTAGVSTLVADHHGTAGLSIANTTRVVTRRHTDPYGAPRGAVPGAWVGDHGFLDKPVDATGLVQVGARYYDPALGRFLSVDPVMDLADPQQWHGYAYANNNPITFTDPTGLRPRVDDGGGVRYAKGSRAYQGDTRPYTPGYTPVAPKAVAVRPPVTGGDGGSPSENSSGSASSGTPVIGEAQLPFEQPQLPFEQPQVPSGRPPRDNGLHLYCDEPPFQSDWGTTTAGLVNFAWGWAKVANGLVQVLGGHPYLGIYNIVTGEVKAANGAVQMWRGGTEGCASDCTAEGNLRRLVTLTVPGGRWTDERLGWWERLGSLP